MLASIAIVAAAVGVLAAPAAADPPMFSVTITCEVEGGGPVVGNAIEQAGTAQKIIPFTNEILRSSDIECIPGTKKITVEKQ